MRRWGNGVLSAGRGGEVLSEDVSYTNIRAHDTTTNMGYAGLLMKMGGGGGGGGGEGGGYLVR